MRANNIPTVDVSTNTKDFIELAAEHEKKCEELSRDASFLYTNLAALQALESFEVAIKTLDKAINIWPQNANAIKLRDELLKSKLKKNNAVTIKQRLQNSPLTSWIWQHWQHEETGNVTMMVFWKLLGRRWYRCKYKE